MAIGYQTKRVKLISSRILNSVAILSNSTQTCAGWINFVTNIHPRQRSNQFRILHEYPSFLSRKMDGIGTRNMLLLRRGYKCTHALSNLFRTITSSMYTCNCKTQNRAFQRKKTGLRGWQKTNKVNKKSASKQANVQGRSQNRRITFLFERFPFLLPCVCVCLPSAQTVWTNSPV